MPAATAKQMVEMLKLALQTNPAGVLSISVDGQVATYSRSQAIEELEFWERRAAREGGRRRPCRTIRLDRGFTR
jgi:uncharacterized protein YdaL